MPLAWLYGIGVRIRNILFDIGVLRTRSFPLPKNCVGNLAVGGTGKTPHTEYLLRLLRSSCKEQNARARSPLKVAVLSRGYKRQSRGFRLADSATKMEEIGDEPWQMMHKFPDISVAVDADRCHGISMLTERTDAETIILDDAFQHRYVKAGLNILLTDYHRLFCHDKLLPAGRLREPASGRQRADVVIVTKCPADISVEEKQEIERQLELTETQKLFYTYYIYGEPYCLFDHAQPSPSALPHDKDILLLTGIASPKPLEEYVRNRMLSAPNAQLSTLHFPDHHNFTMKDVAVIEEKGKGKSIVTTEKDAARLLSLGKGAFNTDTAESIHALPIEVAFIDNKQDEFNQLIIDYVTKNPRNSSIP